MFLCARTSRKQEGDTTDRTTNLTNRQTGPGRRLKQTDEALPTKQDNLGETKVNTQPLMNKEESKWQVENRRAAPLMAQIINEEKTNINPNKTLEFMTMNEKKT